jgi:hypothetical protein
LLIFGDRAFAEVFKDERGPRGRVLIQSHWTGFLIFKKKDEIPESSLFFHTSTEKRTCEYLLRSSQGERHHQKQTLLLLP